MVQLIWKSVCKSCKFSYCTQTKTHTTRHHSLCYVAEVHPTWHRLTSLVCHIFLSESVTEQQTVVTKATTGCGRKYDQKWQVETQKYVVVHRSSNAFIKKSKLRWTHADLCLLWRPVYFPRKQQEGQLTMIQDIGGGETGVGREINRGGTGGSGVSLLMWHCHI